MSLSNCYTPLPVSPHRHQRRQSSSSSSSQQQKQRSPHALRRILMDTSILSQSTGSSLLELGHTKVICSVHGPKSSASSFSRSAQHSTVHTEGFLNCEVRYAPHVGKRDQTVAMESIPSDYTGGGGGDGGGTQITPEEIELSRRLCHALTSSIPLDKFPKCVIDVYVMILQGDGSIVPAVVTAASLALADAGIELYDLVSCCAVAVMPVPEEDEEEEGGDDQQQERRQQKQQRRHYCLVDPNEDETKGAVGTVMMGLLGNNGTEVTFWDQTGRLEAEVVTEAVELCRDGCGILYRCMKKCLVDKIEKQEKK